MRKVEVEVRQEHLDRAVENSRNINSTYVCGCLVAQALKDAGIAEPIVSNNGFFIAGQEVGFIEVPIYVSRLIYQFDSLTRRLPKDPSESGTYRDIARQLPLKFEVEVP